MGAGWIGVDGGENQTGCTGEWGPTDAAAAAKTSDEIGSLEFANRSGEDLRSARVSILVAHSGS